MTQRRSAVLMRFDPFRDLDRLSPEVFGNGRRQYAMPIDAYREGDTFRVALDLPGVDPADVDLTVEKNVLTVRAERRWEWAEGNEVLVAERPQGSYTRQLFLGDTLDADRVSAEYRNGVLTISIPVAEAAKPRRVQIGGDGAQATAIDAGATRN